MRRGLLSALLSVIAALFLTTGHAPAGEAEDRKARSVAVLERENVPYIDWLPVIETEESSVRRTTEVVLMRAVALMMVAVKGETNDTALVNTVIKEFRAAKYFTPEERAFIADPKPSDQDLINFSWRYEGVFVLLWALGLTDDLPRPESIVNVTDMATLFREEGIDGLAARAKLRPQAELLDAADLIYRYHWAVVDARINGRSAPAGLDPGVVYERHYALNWLIGYSSQAWDDITTDT